MKTCQNTRKSSLRTPVAGCHASHLSQASFEPTIEGYEAMALKIRNDCDISSMNQKNIEKDPGRRSGDRKQAFGGSNLIWSLIAVAVAGLFAASLFSNGQEVRLSYTDLERLIRVAGEEKDQSGSPRFVEVVTGETAKRISAGFTILLDR